LPCTSVGETIKFENDGLNIFNIMMNVLIEELVYNIQKDIATYDIDKFDGKTFKEVLKVDHMQYISEYLKE
jgi:CYTH domain-containing protein